MEIKNIIEEKYIKKVPAARFDEIHKLECEEVLDNLGYVRIEKSGDENPSPVDFNELMLGIKQFRAELSTHKSAFRQQYLLPESSAQDLLSEEELDLFDAFCSLEGEFSLGNYSIGEIKANPLLTRILNYRLHTLNLSQKGISPIFDNGTETYLKKVGNWCGFENWKDGIDAIGNIEDLYDKIVRQSTFAHSTFNHIIYFTNKIDTKAERRFRFNNNPARFEERLEAYPPAVIADYKDSKSNRKQFEQKAADELNQFMIRLTQIRLWLSGIYEGRLDSELGALSLNALKDSLKLYQSMFGNTKGFAINDLIVYLKKDRWAINAVFFNGYLKLLAEQGDEKVETINQEIENLYTAIKEEQKTEFLVEFNSILEQGAEPASKLKPYRKTKTRGVKSLYKTVSNFIQKIIKTVKQGLQKIVEKVKMLFAVVKNGISIIYRELKKVYNLLSAGLVFFFGKREIKTAKSGATLFSNFDFNFDSVTAFHKPEKELVEMHLQKCRSQVNALHDVSSFVGKAVNITLKIGSGPLGWLRLGIELIRWLANDAFSYKRFSFE